MLRRDCFLDRSPHASAWLCAMVAVTSIIALAPQRAAACSAPWGVDLLPRVRFVGTRYVPSEMPANGWLYWQSRAGGTPGMPPPFLVTDVTLTDARDGSVVPYVATAEGTRGMYVLRPSIPLVEGVMYELTPSTTGSGEPQQLLVTGAQPAPTSPGGTLVIGDAGTYQYHQLGRSPSGLCTWPAEGRYTDIEIALAPALEPWRDSLLVEWRVDGTISSGSSVDGFYPLPHLGESLAGDGRIRLGIACHAFAYPDGSEAPLWDYGFTPGTHHVEAFTTIAGASAPVSLGAIEVSLSCDGAITIPPRDAGADLGTGSVPHVRATYGCTMANRAAPRAAQNASGAWAALMIAAGVVIARRRRAR